MESLLFLPTCVAGQSLLPMMRVPPPLTWFAGLMLLGALVLFAQKSVRGHWLGQALMFAGLLLGALPVVRLMLLGAVDCRQPAQLERLAALMPMVNGLAWLVMATCAFGAVRALHKLMTVPPGTQTD